MKEIEFIIYVKQKRKEKNILTKDMAALLNVSPSYYSKIENNKISLNFSMIKRISEILDIDLNIIKNYDNFNHIVYYD